MSMPSIHPIPAFNDNYLWCISLNNRCAIVDPGDAVPVKSYLTANGLTLTDILLTHHHGDHVGGVAELVSSYPGVNVIGLDSPRIPCVTTFVNPGEGVTLRGLPLSFEVLAVPGHTLDHIAYYADEMLFCGDTLFSAGCGRLFEGTPQQMLASLKRLCALPDTTRVYCAHEYTLANINFARMAEPVNPARDDYQRWAQQQREQGHPTLPSTIGLEKQINPFLRCGLQSVARAACEHVGHPLSAELEVFSAIRRWKDTV